MKSFRCADIVPHCTKTFQGSEQDILMQVAEHARADHGMASVPPGLVAQVRGLIQTTA